MRRNSLITLLLLVFFFLISWPIISSGTRASFFNLDPDAHYLSSALSHIKQGVIRYTDHPGTPTIFYLVYALTPFRFLAKYISHIPFSTWVFFHFHFLYFFIRILQSLVLTIGLGFFLAAIHRLTRSTLLVLFSALCFLSYAVFPNFGITIGPESLSFLIISLWIYIFSYYLQSGFPGYITILAFIAGVATGNKFSNLFLIFSSISLAVFHSGFTKHQRVINTILTTTICLFGFLVATWPIRGSYPHLFDWVYLLATKTQIHGNGQTAIFDLSAYLSSIVSLVSLETQASRIVALTALLVGYSIYKKRIVRPIVIVFAVTILGILVFAKYPLSHYQLSNYAVIVLIASLLLSEIRGNLLKLVLLGLLIFTSYKNLLNYYKYTYQASSESQQLENYVTTHPPKVATLWEWGRSYHYALIWTRAWGNGFFTEEFKQYYPTILEMSYPDKIVTDFGQTAPLLSVCWDQLYIQRVSYPDFIKANPNIKLTKTEIPNIQSHYLLLSDHCIKNNQ